VYKSSEGSGWDEEAVSDFLPISSDFWLNFLSRFLARFVLSRFLARFVLPISSLILSLPCQNSGFILLTGLALSNNVGINFSILMS